MGGTWIRSGAGGLSVRPSRRATPDAPVSPSSMLSRVIRYTGGRGRALGAVDDRHQVAARQRVHLAERSAQLVGDAPRRCRPRRAASARGRRATSGRRRSPSPVRGVAPTRAIENGTRVASSYRLNHFWCSPPWAPSRSPWSTCARSRLDRSAVGDGCDAPGRAGRRPRRAAGSTGRGTAGRCCRTTWRPRRRAVARRVRGPVGDLGGRLRRQVFVVGRGGGDGGGSSGDATRAGSRAAPRGNSTMSCGLTKLATSRNGRSASSSPARRRAYRSSSQATTRSAISGSRRTPESASAPPCGSGPTQPEKPNGRAGRRRGSARRPRIDDAVVVVGLQAIAVVVVQVGVRDVPLAVVVRVVAAGAEPVAERRHLAGGSQRIRESSSILPRPSVWVTPCTSGYWPVNSVGRLGTHASEPV